MRGEVILGGERIVGGGGGSAVQSKEDENSLVSGRMIANVNCTSVQIQVQEVGSLVL